MGIKYLLLQEGPTKLLSPPACTRRRRRPRAAPASYVRALQGHKRGPQRPGHIRPLQGPQVAAHELFQEYPQVLHNGSRDAGPGAPTTGRRSKAPTIPPRCNRIDPVGLSSGTPGSLLAALRQGAVILMGRRGAPELQAGTGVVSPAEAMDQNLTSRRQFPLLDAPPLVLRHCSPVVK